MAKKKQEKLLTPEEVAKLKVKDPAEDLKNIMALGLGSAYNIGVSEGAIVADTKSPVSKLANVDALPTPVKK